MLSDTLVLVSSPLHIWDVLAPLERKGLTLVGLKTNAAGEAVAAVRGAAGLCSRGAELVASLRTALPPGASLRAATSVTESLELLHATFGPRELVQWEPDGEEEEPCEWAVSAVPSLLGDHNGHCESFWLSELVGAPVGSALGVRFCAQLKRDGYVPLLVGAEQQQLYQMIEDEAASWFEQDETSKLEQAGVYAHVNRKFTGYRNGKFREQLELRQTLRGSLYPQVGQGPYAREGADQLSPAVSLYMRWVDAWARALLRHIAHDVGASADFFEALTDPAACAADAARAAAPKLSPPLVKQLEQERKRLGGMQVHLPPPLEYSDEEDENDAAPPNGKPNGAAPNGKANGHAPPPPPPPPPPPLPPPELCHSLVRACRYDASSEGVYGSGVLCEAHNDVGFLTFDACAATPGLQCVRRADGLWVAVEEAPKPADERMVMMVMVGDTLGYLTRQHYAPCKHRVMAPPAGERIGLPFLFRGRSDAVLDTVAQVAACRAAGRPCHLAEMETTTIKELPAFDSVKSILRNWFASVK